MRRAEVTRDYLTSKGVASNDITLESRGEQDAKAIRPLRGNSIDEWKSTRAARMAVPDSI